MRIGVPKQTDGGETRVALIPETVKRLAAKGVEVVVEAGAGSLANYTDAMYEAAGATTAAGADAVWSACDVVVVVTAPQPDVAATMREDSVLLGMLAPGADADLLRALLARHVTSFAFEAVPRITRAQAMDALSSMSTVAGYRAALLAAQACPKFFPMFMTAAGTLTAAKVLVVGAGVAGLQAIATARRLGANVEAYDVRAAAKEQVLSLGAKFVELPLETGDAETAGGYAKEQTEEQQRKQRELLADHVASADCVITTALVPGRPAPKIITRDMVSGMKPGAVIVDLAAPAGGNCEATAPGDRTVVDGVAILGPTNLTAEMPTHASMMYSRNTLALLDLLAPEGDLSINMDDEVLRGAAITHAGEAVHAMARSALGMSAEPQTAHAKASEGVGS